MQLFFGAYDKKDKLLSMPVSRGKNFVERKTPTISTAL
jgi:hypothetical protein